MVQYAETTTCKRKFLLNHFGEFLKDDTDENEENCCSSCENKDSLLTDVTIPCQKLMSAILRTKEKFGAHYVIDVLLGSKQKKILDYQHDTLSVYGIGTEYSKTDWLNITNLLIAEKYILKSEDYNVLSLTEFAKIALSQRKKIFLPFTPTGKTGKPDSNLLTNLQKKSKVQFSDKEVKLQDLWTRFDRNLSFFWLWYKWNNCF